MPRTRPNERTHVKTHGAERGLNRLEGFSDAVFAIALTLLIVEIKVPGSPEGPHGYSDLARAIAEQWREHLALVLCYLVIGTYWLQHHYSGRIYAKTDHWFGAINLLFLLAIVVIPYPIRVWCFHLGTPFEAVASATLVVGLALIALHTNPVQRRILDWSVRELERRFDLDLVADDLHFNLATRHVVMTNVRLAAIGHRDNPFFTAKAVTVRLPWAAYRGMLCFEEVIVDAGLVRITRDANDVSNLPPGRGRGKKNGPACAGPESPAGRGESGLRRGGPRRR